RAHEPRLRRLEEARAADHEAVERQLPGVIRDEDDAAARRQVLDAERLRAEVVAVEPACELRRGAHAVARQSERVVAELVAVHDERLRPSVDVIGGDVRAKLAEAVQEAHGAQVSARTAQDASWARVD